MNPTESAALAAERLCLDAAGWCSQALQLPSPNQDARPAGMEPDLLVIHNISLPPGRFGGPYIADLFGNTLDCEAHPYFAQLHDLRVSAHFLIRRDGQLLQFVATTQRAWHAGASDFQGRGRCNDFSIGIELEGTDALPFTASQYRRLATLTQALCQRHALRAVTGHEHIAPGRKTDPGAHFDWLRYRSQYRQASAGHPTAGQDEDVLAFAPLR